jgi:hypothetical protein
MRPGRDLHFSSPGRMKKAIWNALFNYDGPDACNCTVPLNLHLSLTMLPDNTDSKAIAMEERARIKRQGSISRSQCGFWKWSHRLVIINLSSSGRYSQEATSDTVVKSLWKIIKHPYPSMRSFLQN